MTLTFGFYNSSSGDRVYDALDMSRLFDGIILDGIYSTLGDSMVVLENSGMDLSIGSGRAWFNHTWSYNDAAVSITIPTADALLDRIDVVYLEINETTRTNSFGVVSGTPASTPVPPTLTETATIHQYALAHVYVAATVTSITQSDITNMVGTANTPFVSGLLDQIDIGTLLTQWEADWDQWFADIQGQLSTAAETNLQNQIWDLAGVLSGSEPYADDMVSLSTHDHSGAHPQIPSGGLATNAVTNSKIANGAVTNTKIASAAVGNTQLVDGAVTNAKIQNNAVSKSKMQDASVGTPELVDGSVTTAKIANGAVDTAQIADESVTAAKIDNRQRTIFIPASELRGFLGSTEGYDNASPGVVGSYWTLDPSDDSEIIYGGFSIPRDCRNGETATIKVLWRCADEYGTARFTFRYEGVGTVSYPGLGAYVVSGTSSENAPLSYVAYLDTIGTFTLYNHEAIMFSLGRDLQHADDQLSYDVRVYGVELTYEADS